MARTPEEAAQWARAQLGHYGWDNLCLSFVRQSFGVDYVGDWPTSSRMAGTAWDRARFKHRETDPRKIPFGVPVFFELPTVADHVLFSTADGDGIGNDFIVNGRIDYNKIAEVAARWGALLGWTEDLVGNRVWSPPTPTPEQPETRRRRTAHVSMQYSDTPDQMRADADKIFHRAKERRFAWVTGTEASEEPLGGILRAAAFAAGFVFHVARGQWIAVNREIIRGHITTGYVPVLESTEGKGRHSDRGITWVGFDDVDLGHTTIGCGHQLTDGRKPGDPNYALNMRYSRAIAAWGREVGKGSALVFYNGDQNINDRTDDTFHGGPFTSIADALKDWQDTGHGPIDVIASSDRDKRVAAVRFEAFPDNKFRLNTDHFFTVGVFEVAVLTS
jgi:hypothetical protein